VCGRSEIAPVELIHAVALTVSPTAGIPVPTVEAAETVAEKVYSPAEPFAGEHVFGDTCVAEPPLIDVVAPLFFQVIVPLEARLAAAPLAVL
jgi:hypothetical protein